ncbi:hypothetical protein NEMBOFW57_005570 [Staphylotrichum longicolle]|uniref:tRNA-intron lyase n=1 Tax=Staphylotrichum longicolle TaxID=669026 RepID=A0AAD4F0J3_9PEZI|nr:hypothetical protein NEMBOFW57_005570 [Staphylotrichum longicolle]
MAEATTVTTCPAGGSKAGAPASVEAPSAVAGRLSAPRPPLNQTYTLPAPIRTFPLPTFYPNNPISLLHLVYAWLSQVLRPPPQEPSVVHTGIWDPETRSVHVRDPVSVRALWEQGFYGKGSLSRSEPNWLKRELARRGSPEGKTVSEARTELRREERRLAKWERAKAELEALEKQRLAEAASHAASTEGTQTNGVLDGPVEVATLAVPANVEPAAVETGLVDAVVAESAATVENTQPTRPARQLDGHLQPRAPVGPAELLALPNSLAKSNRLAHASLGERANGDHHTRKPPVGPAELLLLPNSHAELVSRPVSGLAIFEVGHSAPAQPTLLRTPVALGDAGVQPSDDRPAMNGSANGHVGKASASADSQQLDKASGNDALPDGVNGTVSPSRSEGSSVSTSSAQDTQANASELKRRKSVRFSPTVESTTFEHFDPPSPNRSAGMLSNGSVPTLPNGKTLLEPEDLSKVASALQPASSTAELPLDAPADLAEIENKEHYQLAPEEAFFLAFSLGGLKVVDPVTGSPISTEHLLSLFRSYSYFPPRVSAADLRPDDSFLVNYAVYHHFRSLGWVPRHGIKFGVDWIIYQRGPVFDHSEFGIMVMPAYSDAAWEGHEHEEERRSWSWLMGVNRVLSHVLKSLVLVYVDIPPPQVFDEEMQKGGIAAALKKYTIREVMVRRFSVNRNR